MVRRLVPCLAVVGGATAAVALWAAPALGADANAGYAPAPGAVADLRSPRGSGHDETGQAPASNALSVDRSDSAPEPVVALPGVPVGSVDGTTQPGGLSFAALLVAF